MADLLSRLLAASSWGAMLALAASCGGESAGDGSGTGATGTGGGSTGGSSSGGTGGALDASVDSAGLPKTPYPTPAGCAGPFHEGGYWGQCCETVGCTTPDNGACPPADQVYGKVPGYPSGSGSCSCGSATTGPWAPRDPATEAACCYVFSAISCDGRPLTVDGVIRRAPLVARRDWARAHALAA
ncbi:MAG: hypothetical protein R3B13_18010 [Polyangiaceae bacterium]